MNKNMKFSICSTDQSVRLQEVLFKQGYGWGVYKDKVIKDIYACSIQLNDMGELYSSRYTGTESVGWFDTEDYIRQHSLICNPLVPNIGRTPTRLESLVLENLLRSHLSLQRNQEVITRRIIEDSITKLDVEVEIISHYTWTDKPKTEFERVVL